MTAPTDPAGVGYSTRAAFDRLDRHIDVHYYPGARDDLRQVCSFKSIEKRDTNVRGLILYGVGLGMFGAAFLALYSPLLPLILSIPLVILGATWIANACPLSPDLRRMTPTPDAPPTSTPEIQ